MPNAFEIQPSAIASGVDPQSQWRTLRAGENTALGLAMAISLMAHVLAFIAVTADLLPSWLMPHPDLAGDAEGTDGLNIEIIENASPEVRSISLKPGQDIADQQANAAPPSQSVPATTPAVAATTPALPPAAPLDMAPTDVSEIPVAQPNAAPQKPPAAEPSIFAKMSEAQRQEFIDHQLADFDRSVMTISRAGTARRGEASPFVRAILQILKEAMPRPRGTKGRVIIDLLVSKTGTIEGLRLAQSSGLPELDRSVLSSIRSAHLIAPQKDTPDRDRSFTITYIYD